MRRNALPVSSFAALVVVVAVLPAFLTDFLHGHTNFGVFFQWERRTGFEHAILVSGID